MPRYTDPETAVILTLEHRAKRVKRCRLETYVRPIVAHGFGDTRTTFEFRAVIPIDAHLSDFLKQGRDTELEMMDSILR